MKLTPNQSKKLNKPIRLSFLVAALLAIPYLSHSQTEKCGFDWLQQQWFSNNPAEYNSNRQAHLSRITRFRQEHPYPNYLSSPLPPEGAGEFLQGDGCPRATYIIPVVVHIIRHPGVPATNLDTALIEQQIDILNKAFRNAGSNPYPSVNTGIQFCLAKIKPNNTSFYGINYITSTKSNHTVDNIADLASVSYFPASRYLNIYVVKRIVYPGTLDSSILGYSSPVAHNLAYEGVVIDYNWFGNNNISGSPLDVDARGNTIVHEIGHYLGLYHPFEGNCNSGVNDATCATNGDLCCDVPQVNGINTTCTNTLNTCQNEDYSGIDPNDMKQNFMDYTDEYCQTTFTRDQSDIMLTTLSSIRRSLTTPQNINSLKLACCVLAPRFDGANFICKTDSAVYTSIRYDSATYIWSLYKNGTLRWQRSDTSNFKFIVPPDTGFYTVRLKIITGSSVDSIQHSNYLEVVNCTGTVKSERGNWYFGNHAGIRFTSNGPIKDLNPFYTNFPYNINTYGGSFSQSSASGRLLFYGGGEGYPYLGDSFKVFNKNYLEMKYKNGIKPHGSLNAGQCIAIPFRGDTMKFRLFTMVENDLMSELGGGYYYSIVRVDKDSVYADTSHYLKDSLGIKILPNRGGCYAVVPRCDDKSYWLLCTGIIPINQDSGAIHKYIIDSLGAISYYGKELLLYKSGTASIGVSHDGNMLALNYAVYSFDKKTAKLSILHYFDDEQYINQSLGGAAFSPSGKLTYFNRTGFNSFTNSYNSELFQINPFSASADGEKYVIDKSNAGNTFGHIKMGPDSNLYIARPYRDYVSKIENVNDQFNMTGSSVEYKPEGTLLSVNGQGGISQFGLPNYIEVKRKIDIELDFNYKFMTCKRIKFFPTECCSDSYLWLFGDGNNSTDKYPKHEFVDTGTYTVKLIVNGDTVAKLFNIGRQVAPPPLHGDSLICDFNKYHEYSTPVNAEMEYAWYVYKPTLQVYNGNKIYVKWPSSGYRNIEVFAINTKTGCMNSTEVFIYNGNIPANNTIPTDFIICDSLDFASITGSTPTNVTPGAYSFQWHYIRPDSTWKQIDSATYKNFNPHKVPYSTQLIREVNQSGCRNFSNPLNLIILSQTNKIQLTQSPCTIDSAFIVLGDTAYGDPMDSYINWQYSTNGTDWNYYNTHTQNLDTLLQNDSIYVRRLIDYTGYCEVSSNIIKIVPDVFITKQPLPKYVCSFQDFTYTVEVKNQKKLPLTYWWRHLDSTSNTWSLHLASTNTFTDHAVYHSTDSIQFIIQTPCGYIYSDIVLLKVRHTGPEIDTEPSNQYINEGDRTNLIGEVFNPYETGLSYNWQYRINTKSYNGVSYSWTPKTPTWQYMTDSIRNKLQFIGGICDDSTEYRFVANNGCNSYSNPARLFMTNMADLWMRDSDNDTGAEPNSGVAGWSNPSKRTFDIFKSPDVFNCSNSPGCNSPQNAEFKNNGDNYVHFKIRNRGLQTSKPARLYLYWTLASTGEQWDRHWKVPTSVMWKDPGHSAWTYPLVQYTGFKNLDSGQYFPTGGQINSTGILIQPLDTGDIFDSSYAWRPPNPRWYHTTVNGVRKTETKLQICLLARIEYCDQYPHEMEFNELYRVSVDTNVVNNNNIATHNLWVSDSLPQNTPWNNRPPRNTWTRVFQPRENPGPVTIHISDVDPVYDPGVRVIVTMDDSLHQAWVNGGLIGTGFIPLGYQRYELTSSNATFGNIYSDSALVGNIGVEFLPLDTTYLPTDTSYYTLSQTYDENGSYEGGVIFRVDFNSTTTEEGDGLAPFNPSLSLPQEKISKYILYPNPANTKLTVYISSPKNKEHAIVITDLAGRTLITEKCQFLQSDTCSKEIDISRLAAGAYLVRLTSGNETDVRKITILR